MANPITASFLERIRLDGMHAFTSYDRKLAVYPCRRGTLLNVAAIHPAGPQGTTGARQLSWLDGGNLDQLLQAFEGFGLELLEMCRMAEDIKLWSLGSRKPPHSFYKDNLVLIGHAAHPTFPRGSFLSVHFTKSFSITLTEPDQGQGGAQSFEDGAALAAVLPSNTTTEQIPQRLELYNQVRYAHSMTVMIMSRVDDSRRGEMADELRKYVPDATVPENMFSFAWNSYPAREAEGLLRAVQCA